MDKEGPPAKERPGPTRRRRPALACEACRARKIKCDRNTPCNKCIRGKRARTCTYVPDGATPVPRASSDRLPTPLSADGLATQATQQAPAESASVKAAPAELLPTSQPNEQSNLPTKATRDKGKLFGASHWTNTLENLPKMLRFDELDPARHPQIKALLLECKQHARKAKRHPASAEPTVSDLRDKMPPRPVADQLMQQYLETFETVYRIHHVPSFRQEYEQYWSSPESASDTSVVKLLLVLALGTCFNDDDGTWYCASMQWVIAAHTWASSPFAKNRRITLVGVQIHCLLMLARQTHAVGGDFVWVSAGSLLRTAMQIGLNRDPVHLQISSPVEAEVRRRVWATTTELLVQASIDAGQPPLFSIDDFDCKPPSDTYGFDMHSRDHIQSAETPISTQNILAESLPVRLQIAKFLNHFRSDLSYSTALDLNAQLTKHIRTRLASFNPSSERELFQCKMVEFLTYRFLIALHQAFAAKAKASPSYYFSRKMCLDACLLILNINHPDPGSTLYKKLVALGNGMLHTTFLQSAGFVVLELMWQQDDSSNFSSLVTESSLTARREQLAAIRLYSTVLRERLRKGQSNFKAYVFLAAAIVQLEDVNGKKPDENVLISRVEELLQDCSEILAQAATWKSDFSNDTPSTHTSELGDLGFDIGNFPFDWELSNVMPLSNTLFPESIYWPVQE
ncbi:Transcription factor lepE [Lasiodiplodia theobromae]|uniref:Transcription factor lepE n=1 Tax=Lasiodiplodia theobromae TaxID=45133 RepID=A0A5N5DTH3_9PEZI|nr:Transcription factor lepE [Lasiodiplodia theobromae]